MFDFIYKYKIIYILINDSLPVRNMRKVQVCDGHYVNTDVLKGGRRELALAISVRIFLK